MDGSSDGQFRNSAKRRRARKACLICNRRKVRCDVAIAGQPCANCKADGVSCELVPRKKRTTHSRLTPSVGERNDRTSVIESNSNDDAPTHPLLQHDHPTVSTSVEIQDEGQNADALAAAIEEQDEQQPNDGLGGQNDIYYTGNAHSAVSFVSHIAGTSIADQNVHYLRKHTAHKPLSAEDLTYLQYRGCFSLPPDSVCDTLLRSYFIHVHPLLPILEASTFLRQVTRSGCQDINLLLLWSMFFVAAGFIDRKTLRESGFATRKALKRTAYERAKVLYDLSQDHDQIILIQAVILMGHWHDNAEDRFEAWHWTGIAISLCQTVGMHCSPVRTTGKSSAIDVARERLCRRIWWTCVCRDRWLSMVKGRPLRIRLEDGNASPPTVEDLQFDLQQIPEQIKPKYFPFNAAHVSYLWSKQVEISILLGKILLREVPFQAMAYVDSTQVQEPDLIKCDWPPSMEVNMHVFEKMCEYHVRLLYHASCIAFWRPLILMFLKDTPEYASQQEAVIKSRQAAIKSNAVLEELASQDLLKYMKSQTITALVPAMQIHLLDSESSTKSISMLGTNRLQLCMDVLIELKETYWAAEFAIKLFERAREKLAHRKRVATSSNAGNDTTMVSSNLNSTATSPPSLNHSPTAESLILANEIFVPGCMFWDETTFGDATHMLWNNSEIGLDSGLDTFLSMGNFSSLNPGTC